MYWGKWVARKLRAAWYFRQGVQVFYENGSVRWKLGKVMEVPLQLSFTGADGRLLES